MANDVIAHSRPYIGVDEHEAVLATLASGWVGAGGAEAVGLAADVARLIHRPAAVAVSSGTAAIEIALRIVGVEGGRVAVPAFGCQSVERAVIRAGGLPDRIDNDLNDLSFPPGALTEAASRCVAAVLVHQFGIPAAATAELPQSQIPVIEDITTAIGGMVGDRVVGTTGRCAVVSMAATKMVCAGQGGVIAGSIGDVDIAQRWTDPESSLPADAPVPNAKLSDMLCAMGRVQLRRLPEFLSRRAEIAAYYDGQLDALGLSAKRPQTGDTGTWWRYLVELPPSVRPEPVVEHALAQSVTFARPVFGRRWATDGEFPNADRLLASLISLPIYPAMTDEQIERVGRVLGSAIHAASACA